jgi:glutathione peroxidase
MRRLGVAIRQRTLSRLRATTAQVLHEAVDTGGPVAERLEGFLAKTGGSTNLEPGVLWNFEKFLVGRDGKFIGRFSPEITPDDPILVSAIDSALSA